MAPLRYFHSIVVGYFSVIYTLALMGFLDPISFGADYFRKVLWLLYILPVYDVIADRRRND